MVKKIRVYEDEPTDEEHDAKDFQTELLALLKSMDWKLWELLQIEQRKEVPSSDKSTTKKIAKK